MKYHDYHSLKNHPIDIWLKKYEGSSRWEEIPALLSTLDDKNLDKGFRYLLGRELTLHIYLLLKSNEELPKDTIANFLTPFLKNKQVYHFMTSSHMMYNLDQTEYGRIFLLEHGIDLSRTHPKHRQYALERTVEKYGNQCIPQEGLFDKTLNSAREDILRYSSFDSDWKSILKNHYSIVLATIAQEQNYALSHQDFQRTFLYMYNAYYTTNPVQSDACLKSDRIFPFNRFIDLLLNSPYCPEHVLNNKKMTQIFEKNFFVIFDKKNKKQMNFKQYAQNFLSNSLQVCHLRLNEYMNEHYSDEEEDISVKLKI
jgi:hypothetical protein